MSTVQSVDIAIVGGGLAGASLALALTQINAPQSLRIAIIETKPPVSLTTDNQDGRTLVLAHGSACIYDNLGLWDTLAPLAYPLQHIHVSERKSFGATRFSAKQQGVPALGYVVPLTQLQTQLYQALHKQINVMWHSPDRVSQLDYRDDQVHLRLRSGNTITAQLVVGADGAHSTIRKLLGITVEHKQYPEQALVTRVTVNDTKHTAYERFSRDHTIALLPKSDHCYGLVWTGTPEQVNQWQTLPPADFLQTLQSEFGYRAGKFIEVSDRQVFPLQLSRAQAASQRQVVLIGHAAHTIHPIGAQGFNLTLRDSATLAQIIETGLADGKTVYDPVLLAQYCEQRQRDQHNIIRATDFLASAFRSNLVSLRIARNIGLLTCDLITPLKTRLARHPMGIAGKLPRIACKRSTSSV